NKFGSDQTHWRRTQRPTEIGISAVFLRALRASAVEHSEKSSQESSTFGYGNSPREQSMPLHRITFLHFRMLVFRTSFRISAFDIRIWGLCLAWYLLPTCPMKGSHTVHVVSFLIAILCWEPPASADPASGLAITASCPSALAKWGEP